MPASNRVEQTIIDIWQQLLGIEQVGIHDNFFDLGGNSLLGVDLMTRVQQALTCEKLPAYVLYQAPTVSALARALKSNYRSLAVVEMRTARGERRRESLHRAPRSVTARRHNPAARGQRRAAVRHAHPSSAPPSSFACRADCRRSSSAPRSPPAQPNRVSLR